MSPSFTKLSDAVDFIAHALDVGEHGALADACGTREQDAPDLPTRRESRLRAIELLAGVHREKPLRSLYAGRAFPARESRLKLGGHARELEHLHVDFVRVGPDWQLENIWLCR
jgi:hypothetical protein